MKFIATTIGSLALGLAALAAALVSEEANLELS